MKKFFALVLISACFILPALSPAYSAVRNQNNTYFIDDAVGSAKIVNGNKAAAREEARRNAYRDAIEKAMGTLVPGMSERNSYGAISGRVFSQASGLVKNFKVTSENIEGDTLTITGSCNVSEKSFDKILGPEVISMLGNPRIMIVVEQPAAKDGEKKAPAISPLEMDLISIFEKAGYLIVDMDQARTLLALDKSNAYNDTEKLIGAAKTLRADVIIVARSTSSSSSTTVHGVKMYKSSGSVQLKAVQTQTAYQIGTASSSGATGWGGSPAGGRIVSSGARKAAEDLIYKIAYNMASAGSSLGGITVNVKIANATFKNVENIEEGLREWLATNGEIFERAYDNGVLELDVVSPKTARNVASFLSDFADIEGLTAQTINARVRASRPASAPAPTGGIAIAVNIDNVKNIDDASRLENGLKNFVGSSGEVKSSYAGTSLTLNVIYPGNASDIKDSQALASFLKGQKITIDGVQEDSIKGHKLGGWLW